MTTPTLVDLSKEALEQLYLDEGLTDQEIAERYGTYQVKISRLRGRYGISTILKSERTNLPELTERQQGLLIGSMLGDGRLFSTGSSTAAYSEYHSDAQRAYLDWKTQEWGDYVQSVRPNVKVKDGRDYHGSTLRLYACKVFRPYWEMFYPSGSGNKTFHLLQSTMVDALALAIWFLDDGSRTDSYIRFATSGIEADSKVQLRILRRFGLRPLLYRDRGDTAIHIQGRTYLTRFLDLVKPHIPECMAYKLVFPQPRALGPAPRDLVTRELLQAHIEQGHGATRIARSLNVSAGVVRRAMDKNGFARPRHGRPRGGKATPSWEGAKTYIKSLGESPDIEAIVQALLPLSLPPRPSMEEVRNDFENLRGRELASLSGDIVSGGNYGGTRACRAFFDHRYDSRYRDYPSVRSGWADPYWLRRAIKLQRCLGDPLFPANVFRALNVVLRGPTNFRPSVAAALVQAYTPRNGLVLDPCAGYGGRALGTLAVDRRYLGVDPHPKAQEAFQNLFTAVSCEGGFVQAPFEDVDLEVQADMVLTSPPYFDVERYSDDVDQSWVRYPLWSQWVDDFLRQLVLKSYAYLRPEGVMCLNVNDIRQRRTVLPLVAETIRLALEVGFQHETTLKLALGRFGRVQKFESLLVFRKARRVNPLVACL